VPAVARDPFRFWTRLTLTKLTGRRAADLAELVHVALPLPRPPRRESDRARAGRRPV